MTSMTMVQALNAGLRRALEDDPKVLLMGEDIGPLGGVFAKLFGAVFGLQNKRAVKKLAKLLEADPQRFA